MKHVYENALISLEAYLARIEGNVPPPVRVPRGDSFVFRYSEKSVGQAIILKMARSISSLHAATILLENGHVQEVCVLQRVIDDFQEEVMFLGLSQNEEGLQPIHLKFLEATFADEFKHPDDPYSALEVKRPFVSRKDIRKEINRIGESNAQKAGLERPPSADAVRVVSMLYSGYVHGGASSVMEMFGGNPPHYHLSGLSGTSRIGIHERDLWHQFYRTTQGFRLSAMVFGDESLYADTGTMLRELEEVAGYDYGDDKSGDS